MAGLLGIMLGVFFGFFSCVNGAGAWAVAANFAAAAASALLVYMANKTGNYAFFFIVGVTSVFFLLFPALFFVSGGYHGGTPFFFVFGVVFTVLMLEGRTRTVMTVAEICIFFGCFIVAYQKPEIIIFFTTEEEAEMDRIIGFLMASSALALAVNQFIIVYDRKHKQLEQVYKERAELFGNISHEMKTPLAVISTSAQLIKSGLKDTPDLGNYAEDARVIINEANRLGMIVTQILEFAREQESAIQYDIIPCDIGEIIRSTVAAHFSSTASVEFNRVELSIEDGLPPVFADAARITQVIVNLVSNAVKHTAGGLITISASKKDNKVALSVADNGAGIGKDEADMIFDRWYTGDQTSGTGLGLYICKKIAEAHGGGIFVTSEPGRGSRFTVLLPAAS